MTLVSLNEALNHKLLLFTQVYKWEHVRALVVVLDKISSLELYEYQGVEQINKDNNVVKCLDLANMPVTSFLRGQGNLYFANKGYFHWTTAQGLGTFCGTQWDTKHNVHRLTLNLHGLRIMVLESFASNITCWGF